MCPSCIILTFIFLAFGITLTTTQAAVIFIPMMAISTYGFWKLYKKTRQRCKDGICLLPPKKNPPK